MRRFAGGTIRAALVFGLVLAPSVLLPASSAQLLAPLALLAATAAAFTLAEYVPRAPALIEFRDAAPYNRARYAILLANVLLAALALRDPAASPELSRLARAAGSWLGDRLDMPWGPLGRLLALAPPEAGAAAIERARVAAGLVAAATALGLALFALAVRGRVWPPGRRASREVWRNLPTFDGRGDLVARLRRDGAVNLALAFVLPYATPPMGLALAGLYGAPVAQSELILAWAIALWAFLPACLVMRAIALRRLADRLAVEARRPVRDVGAAGSSPGPSDPDVLPI